MKHLSLTRLIAVVLAVTLLLSMVVYAADPPAAEEPTDPAAPTVTDPADSTPPEEATPAPTPTDETTPADPTPEPAEPTTPDDPTEPTDPVDPTQPEDPTEPTDPAEPTEPTEPEEPTEPPEPKEIWEMTDEELIEAYDIADNWARSALIFALREGLLKGKGDKGLCPKDDTTRAEVVTVLTRVLQTQTKADLSAYTDVRPGAWYYDSIALGKALGIINGTGDTTMSPNAKITREQVFTMLARAFGYNSTDWEPIYRFEDALNISAWAAPRIAAMTAAEKVNGSNGYLKPKNNITRQELAQVFYNLIRGKGETLPDAVEGSFALSADEVTPGAVVNGDLIVCGEGSTLCLEGVTVNGRLVIQGNGPVELELRGCKLEDLVLCRPTTLRTDRTLPKMEINSPVTLAAGSAERAEIYEGGFAVSQGASVKQATLLGDNITLTVNGSAGTVTVKGQGTRLDGTGWVNAVEVGRESTTVTCPFGSMSYPGNVGIQSVTAQKAVDNTPTVREPAIPVTIRMDNTPNDRRHCQLTWYLEGKKVAGPYLLSLYDGANFAYEMDFKPYLRDDIDDTDVTVKAVLKWQNEEKTFLFNYSVMDGIVQAAKQVRPQNVEAWAKRATNIYSWSDLSGYKGRLSSGEYVVYLGYYSNVSSYIRTSSGMTGWVSARDMNISEEKYYVTWDYSKQVKEYYVNHMRSVGSNTKYMIWINPWTQRVNVFQGSRDNWKLIHSYPCATGTNDHVTKIQDTTIQYKTAAWEFSDFYVDKVSIIDNQGRAFHSRPKNYNGTVNSWTMSQPASHGCIRMLDDGCQFIYYNVPTGSRVIVY